MISARDYAKSVGVVFVGKLTMKYEGYGFNKKQKVYIDEVGNKFYPSNSFPTIVLNNGRII